ncbi:hypothetical protein ACNO8X_09275 [Mycobacterium sp. PDNC021]|uniref:hypothetical protein n=1 Tax=Mycobacterium sp. PDNC021 TaxID=3391399 RepID=UPI003AAADEAF
MSTTLTATFPDLAFTSDPASGTIHGAPTMPISALAWSLAEPEEPVAQRPVPAAPVASTRTPRTRRVGLVAMLFGGVTVVAALGAIGLGADDSPSTPLAVVDHTRSAPYVAPAPAPMPTVNHVAAPAPVPVVNVVTAPVVAPPKAIAPAQPIAAPPVAETPTQQRPHWTWLRRILQQHHEDHQDQKR